MDYEYIVTINYGLERISSNEVFSITGKRPAIGNNILRFKGEEEDGYKLLLWGRTIHRLLLLVEEGSFKDLDDLKRQVYKLDYKPYYKRGSSFALKTSRYGEHSFTSIDVNKIIGGAIHEKLNLQGLDPKVDLKNPDIQFIMRIVDNTYMLTINLSGESLHVRGYRKYNHPAAIKTSIAAAMILLSGWRDQDLIDPMAGGGTIPIEAALYKYNYAPGLYRDVHPVINIPLFDSDKYMRYRLEAFSARIESRMDIKIIYNDISRKYFEGALLNASSAGVRDFIDFYNVDAKILHKYNIKLRDGFIAVFNPPYGIRMTRDKAIPTLYRSIISELISMGCSKVVVITAAWRHMQDAFIDNNVKLIDRLQIKHGNLDTFILYGVYK